MLLLLIAGDPNMWSIISIIVTVIIALPAFISAIIFGCKRLSVKRFYDAFFSSLNFSDDEKFHFKHYIKHSFNAVQVPVSEETLKYIQFLKNIKDSKIVIITGSAGIGKSVLMQRLAFKFRKKIQKGQTGEKLNDYCVLFEKLNKKSDLNKILGETKQRTDGASRRFALFFDGLDELSELSVRSGSEILNNLLDELLNDFSDSCSKIFISLRPEILSGGYLYNLPDEKENIKVFKIKNLDNAQITSLYRRVNRDRSKKIAFKERRTNFKKLKAVIKSKTESVFSYPLILTWANEILSDYGIEELTSISWYTALGKVIDKELEREYKIYCASKGKRIGPSDYPIDVFKSDGKKFLSEIALDMVISQTQSVTEDKIHEKDVVKRFNETQNETTGNTFLTRRLLKYIDYSETSGKRNFEFIHNTIFWRVLADVILDPETPQSVRSQIIAAYYKLSTTLFQYFYQGLWSKHKNGSNIFPYNHYVSYMSAINEGAVRCDSGSLPLEIIISCFYGLNEIDFHSVKFNAEKIKKFVDDGKLDLSYANFRDLSFLNNFSSGSFKSLDCSYSYIEKADIPAFLKNFNFKQCKSLKHIDIPNGIQTIAGEAFCRCDSLKSVAISDSVESICCAAFWECGSLASVKIGKNVKIIDKGAFAQCSSLTSVKIPDNVESIGNSAFWECGSLASVKIGKNVKIIDKGAFAQCSSLISVNIPDSVESVGHGAFAECRSLASVTIGKNVKIIDQCAFVRCSSLTSVKIPDNVESIGNSAFWECGSLASVKIGKNVKIIDKGAFAQCSSLISVNIPDNVESIGDSAFAECISLASVTIGKNVKIIGESAFAQCSSLISVNIPDSVESVGHGAFAECRSLASVTIGKNVKIIDQCAFVRCSSLTSVKIPDNVESIGNSAFWECGSLASVTIGKNVKIIDKGAFAQCSSLISVNIPDNVESIGDSAFWECISLAGVTIGKNVKIIDRCAFIRCGTLTSIKIPDSVESIGENAFEECKSLERVTLGKKLKNIGLGAFFRCGSLTSVNIPDSVESIGDSAFGECVSLASVTIGNNVKIIDRCAFFGCSSLTSVNIPGSVEIIGDGALCECSSLASVTIGNNVKNIGRKAFDACFSLSSINYNGTKAQWEAIEKGDSGMGNYTIHCIDGDIVKSEDK